MNATSKKINLKSLRSDIDLLKKTLLNLNFQKSSGQLEKTSEIRVIKKKIALLMTEINQIKRDKNA